MITSYDTMPVGVYQALQRAIKDREDGAGEGDDLDILAILAGCTRDELMHLPLPAFLDMKERAAFLFEQPDWKRGIQSTYDVGDFHCVVVQRPEELTAAQYIDIKEYGKLEGDALVEVLSVLLIPEGCKYNDGYSVADLQDAIRKFLPVTEAVALRDFFTLAWARLTRDTLRYSVRKLPLRLRWKTRREIRQATKGLTGLLKSGSGRGGQISSLTLPDVLGMIRYEEAASNFSDLSATGLTNESGRTTQNDAQQHEPEAKGVRDE